MTAQPTTVRQGSRLPLAVEILRSRKISELPVVDEHGRPVGLIDITDVVTLLPTDEADESPAQPHQSAPTEAVQPKTDPATLPFTNLPGG
jgi:arabinose-5-phosphate isomerase